MFEDAGYGVIPLYLRQVENKNELPDIIAGKNNEGLHITTKASGRDRIYLEEEVIDNLTDFSEVLHAQSIIAVHFDREDWYFFTPNELYQTESGNYRVKKDKALNEGMDFYELIGIEKQKQKAD
jgi:Holliday junction resolvase